MPAKHDAAWDKDIHRQGHAPALSDPPGAPRNCSLASGPWLPTALLAFLRQVWLHPWWLQVAGAPRTLLSPALISRAAGHSSGKTLCT